MTGLSRSEPPLHHDLLKWLPVDLGDLSALGSVVRELSTVDAVAHAAGLRRSAPL